MHTAVIVFCVAAAVIGIPLAAYGICRNTDDLQQLRFERIRLEHMRQELNHSPHATKE